MQARPPGLISPGDPANGKRGDVQTNRRDEQELLVLCLRILQAALVCVNTLMLQDVLAEPAWAELLTATDAVA